MVKSEFVLVLNGKLPELRESDVELAVNCILEQMNSALAIGERIEVRGFGSFSVRQRPPRLARNPKTGETVNLPAKTAVYFKPDKEIRDRVDAARDQCRITD